LKQAHTDLIGFIPIVKHLIDYLAKDDPSYCIRAIKRQWSEEPHYSISDSLLINFDSLMDVKFHNTLRDVAKRNPEHYESQLLLIRSYLDMDQFEEASKHLSEALEGEKKRRACALMAEYCLRSHANKTEVMRWLRDSMEAKEDKQFKDYYWNLKKSSWQNYNGKNCIYVDSI
jgi:HemY protein